MMRWIRTAGLTAIALSLSSLPAAAVTRAQMMNRLESYGIRLVHQDTCTKSTTVATYHYGINRICLSQHATESGAMFDESLTHEAVHVAQDCAAGLHNNQLITLADHFDRVSPKNAPQFRHAIADMLSKSDLNLINNYPAHKHGLEIEAYSLENSPSQVYQLLELVCSN